jgi:hypothetical protein
MDFKTYDYVTFEGQEDGTTAQFMHHDDFTGASTIRIWSKSGRHVGDVVKEPSELKLLEKTGGKIIASTVKVLKLESKYWDYADNYEFCGEAKVSFEKDNGFLEVTTLPVCLDFGGEWMYCTKEYGEAISEVDSRLVEPLNEYFKLKINLLDLDKEIAGNTLFSHRRKIEL